MKTPEHDVETILITGATGNVGSVTLAALVAESGGVWRRRGTNLE